MKQFRPIHGVMHLATRGIYIQCFGSRLFTLLHTSLASSSLVVSLQFHSFVTLFINAAGGAKKGLQTPTEKKTIAGAQLRRLTKINKVLFNCSLNSGQLTTSLAQKRIIIKSLLMWELATAA